MTRITSAVSLALLLCTSACGTKKQTQPTTPAPAATTPDAEPAPAPAPGAPPIERMNAPAKPAPTSNGKKPSDPCQGGELK